MTEIERVLRHLEEAGVRCPELPMTEVDVFVDLPFDFDETHARAALVELGEGRVHVASIRDVIAMKRRVARPKDLEDVAALEQLARSRGEPSDG